MGISQERRNTSKEAYPISSETLQMFFNYHFEAYLASRSCQFQTSEAQIKCIKYMQQWLISDKAKAGLLIYGAVGVGKSTITKALQMALSEYRNTIKFWVEQAKVGFDSKVREMLIFKTYSCRVPKLVTASEIAEAMSDEDDFNLIKGCSFLIIDDLGIEPSEIKDFGTTKKPFEELLYYRYDKLLPTIITSNLDVEDIRTRYGERVSDRFNEMFNIYGVNGESFRK